MPRSASRRSYTMTLRMSGLFRRIVEPSGVVRTSTGPRLASSAISGVVRTTSPRKLVCTTSDVTSLNLKNGEEGLLRNLHRTDLLHPLLAFLLLLEELALARDVAAITLGENVFAQRLHRRASYHLLSDRSLDRDLEQLPRNELLQLVGDLPSPLVRLVAVDDHRK